MADAESLTHAFMRGHPAEAAQALEPVPPGDVAQLLARTPARIGAPVLTAMLPSAAARTLEALDDERARELLDALPVQAGATLLRNVAEPRRTRLIDGLSTAKAVASRVLLRYPADAVGTWADPQVVALRPDATVAQALERARGMEVDAAQVFVVDAEQRLVGWTGLPALLRAPEFVSLESLMARPDAMLAAQTTIAGALAHPGWLRHTALPVVESGDRLLGVLTRDALARAHAGQERARSVDAPHTLSGAAARGYWSVLSGSLAAAITLLPSVPPVAGGDDAR